MPWNGQTAGIAPAKHHPLLQNTRQILPTHRCPLLLLLSCRLMGRAASHITLECALQTHPQARRPRLPPLLPLVALPLCPLCLLDAPLCTGTPSPEPLSGPRPHHAGGADLRGGGCKPLGPEGRRAAGAVGRAVCNCCAVGAAVCRDVTCSVDICWSVSASPAGGGHHCPARSGWTQLRCGVLRVAEGYDVKRLQSFRCADQLSAWISPAPTGSMPAVRPSGVVLIPEGLVEHVHDVSALIAGGAMGHAGIIFDVQRLIFVLQSLHHER